MYIFSNNFRGSPDGWSQLLVANFLVGENSTGKSSYGKLLKIIWSPEFQHSNKCILEKYSTSEFGDYFSKIAKDHSETKSFTIGFLSPEDTNNSEDIRHNDDHEPYGKLISYIEVKGAIRISRMTIIKDRLITSVSYSNRKLFRSKVKYSKRLSLSGLAKKFSEIHDSKLNKQNSTLMKVPPQRPPHRFWSMLVALKEDKIPEGEVEYSSSFLKTTGRFRHLGPIRQRPERLYFVGTESNDPEGKGSLNRMKRSFSNNSFKEAMNKFGVESGMFDTFKVVDLSKHVEKNAFSIKFRRNGQDFYTDELGFGVSQVIPLLVEMMVLKKHPIILLEQPELHLHPKAQAAFGELLYEFSKGGSIFIVETHSDFIIDRFRVSLAKDKINAEDKVSSQVVFYKKNKGKNTSNKIQILPDGNYLKPPRAYRKFFLDEELKKFNAI